MSVFCLFIRPRLRAFPVNQACKWSEKGTPGLILAAGAGAVVIRLFPGRVQNARFPYSLQSALLGISTFSSGLCWHLAAYIAPSRGDRSAVLTLQKPERPSWSSGQPFYIFQHSISIWRISILEFAISLFLSGRISVCSGRDLPANQA